ncbi:hypothetical protein DPMN_088210 [Dreissena polymorpha]|uniref:Uncharacterized protein n=1 Tax=Dreissena polymorpha TaxID=45954 RepID=A0A9D4KTP5_DREPO|nr:hypothetical protein DPMN_088210 [Dreissena polymorpha]
MMKLVPAIIRGRNKNGQEVRVWRGNKHDIKPVLDAVSISACKGYVMQRPQQNSAT